MAGPEGDRLLRVDMTTQTASFEDFPTDWRLLGGRGGICWLVGHGAESITGFLGNRSGWYHPCFQVFPAGGGELATEIGIPGIGPVGDVADGDFKAGGTGEGEGIEMEITGSKYPTDTRPFHRVRPPIADGQRQGVDELEKAVVLGHLVGRDRRALLQILAGLLQPVEQLHPTGLLAFMLVESESVLGNQQGDIGLFGDKALGAALPDFETRRKRVGEKVVGAAALRIDPWCRVGLLPPVVVLTYGLQKPLAAGVLG